MLWAHKSLRCEKCGVLLVQWLCLEQLVSAVLTSQCSVTAEFLSPSPHLASPGAQWQWNSSPGVQWQQNSSPQPLPCLTWFSVTVEFLSPAISFPLPTVAAGRCSQAMNWQPCLAGGCFPAGRRSAPKMLMWGMFTCWQPRSPPRFWGQLHLKRDFTLRWVWVMCCCLHPAGDLMEWRVGRGLPGFWLGVLRDSSSQRMFFHPVKPDFNLQSPQCSGTGRSVWAKLRDTN